MRVPRSLPLLSALAAAFLLAACSDSSTDAGATLSQQEAEVMFSALMEATGSGVIGVGIGFSEPMAAEGIQAQDSFEWEESITCTGGGTVEQSGSVTINTNTGAMSWDLTETHANCRGMASDGTHWAFDGDPNLSTSLEVSGSETSYSLSGTQSGGIRWSQGGDSGRCSIDMNYSTSSEQTSADTVTLTVTVSGQVCGNSVTFTDTETVQL